MKNYRFTFKIQGDSTTYTYNGTLESFNSIYPNATIIKKESAPIWDEDLQDYI